jgi:anti-anti-sigma factor
MRSLQVNTQFAGPVTILILAGEIGALSHGDLEEAYHQALDFTKVEYINSAGLAGLIQLIAEAGSQGLALCVCGLTQHYRGLFELMRLTEYMCISENCEKAISDCLALVSPQAEDHRNDGSSTQNNDQ